MGDFIAPMGRAGYESSRLHLRRRQIPRTMGRKAEVAAISNSRVGVGGVKSDIPAMRVRVRLNCDAAPNRLVETEASAAENHTAWPD